MFGDEGAVPAFVSPSNGQSSRLTSVRFRSLQILQGMFALISIPPHLGDCCIRMIELYRAQVGPVAELVGIEGGVVSGVFNIESSDVGASDRRPRHEENYHEV